MFEFSLSMRSAIVYSMMYGCGNFFACSRIDRCVLLVASENEKLLTTVVDSSKRY